MCLPCAGPVSGVPFVLLSLKAQLPLLMNRPKEGVQALHDLLHYCQSKAGAQPASSDSAAAEQGTSPQTQRGMMLIVQLRVALHCQVAGAPGASMHSIFRQLPIVTHVLPIWRALH